MTTLREKVARAISGGIEWDEHDPRAKRVMRKAADAAIRAVFDHLANPSEVMIGAAQDEGPVALLPDDEVVLIWRAMLSAARDEILGASDVSEHESRSRTPESL